MRKKNKQIKNNTKLSQEDISELAKLFYLLWQMDKKNIGEGKYRQPITIK